MNINMKGKMIGKTSKESFIMMWTILEKKLLMHSQKKIKQYLIIKQT